MSSKKSIRVFSGGGAGTVVGPGSSTNNALVLFDGTTGALIKDSGVVLGAGVSTALAIALNAAGGLAPVSSHSLVTPTATTLAIGGATIGSNALAVAGTAALNGTTTISAGASDGLRIIVNQNSPASVDFRNASAPNTSVWQWYLNVLNDLVFWSTVDRVTISTGGNLALKTGTFTQTSASATAFTSGPNGSTNPVFRVDNNTLKVAIGVGTGTPTYGLHLAPSSGLTAGQTVFIQDATATTGQTRVVIKAGAANGDLFQIQDKNGVVLASCAYDGTFGAAFLGTQDGTTASFAQATYGVGLNFKATALVNWTSTGSWFNAVDTAISRISAGLIGIGTGAQGSFAGHIKATNFISDGVMRFKGYTVATLPAGTAGDNAYVTDALAPTFLATVVGGGAIVTPVFYNGSAWVGA